MSAVHRSHAREAISSIRSKMLSNLEAAAEMYLEELRRVLTGRRTGRVYKTHVASAPGEAPAEDTGKYRESFEVAVDHRKLVAHIGTSERRAAALELGTRHIKPRPHMVKAFSNVEKTLKQQLSEEVR